MEDLSLHILDVVENSIRAKAKKIKIKILEDESKGRLVLSIEDDGEGMKRATVKKALDPFFTTKDKKRIGLGLALLAQAAKQAGGWLKVDSKPGEGTKLKAIFKLDHPDMKPMGDMRETMATLILENPSIRFIYDHKTGDSHIHFDSFRDNMENNLRNPIGKPPLVEQELGG